MTSVKTIAVLRNSRKLECGLFLVATETTTNLQDREEGTRTSLDAIPPECIPLHLGNCGKRRHSTCLLHPPGNGRWPTALRNTPSRGGRRGEQGWESLTRGFCRLCLGYLCGLRMIDRYTSIVMSAGRAYMTTGTRVRNLRFLVSWRPLSICSHQVRLS